jgi:hypothetical protein
MGGKNHPQWKIWLHELLHQDYSDAKLQNSISVIAADAYIAINEYSNATNIAIAVRDVILSVGATLSSVNNTNSMYFTISNTDGSNTYILLEMENMPNINKADWVNRLGLVRDTHRVNVHLSVIVPSNEIANNICNNIFSIDVGNRINYLHTYMYFVHNAR